MMAFLNNGVKYVRKIKNIVCSTMACILGFVFNWSLWCEPEKRHLMVLADHEKRRVRYENKIF